MLLKPVHRKQEFSEKEQLLWKSCYSSEGADVLEFLSTIFYPHGKGFRKKIAKYIDLESSLLSEEVDRMSGLGESIYLEGMEQGIEAFILDNLEEKIPKERIIEKLQRRFRLTEAEARAYFEKYAMAVW